MGRFGGSAYRRRMPMSNAPELSELIEACLNLSRQLELRTRLLADCIKQQKQRRERMAGQEIPDEKHVQKM